MYKLIGKRGNYIGAYFIFDWPSLDFGIGWNKDYQHNFHINIGPFRFIVFVGKE